MHEKYLKELVEPMKGTEFPDRPWSRDGAEFFDHRGQLYLIVVDYVSGDA